MTLTNEDRAWLAAHTATSVSLGYTDIGELMVRTMPDCSRMDPMDYTGTIMAAIPVDDGDYFAEIVDERPTSDAWRLAARGWKWMWIYDDERRRVELEGDIIEVYRAEVESGRTWFAIYSGPGRARAAVEERGIWIRQ